jgi:flagellar export protein FliJ
MARFRFPLDVPLRLACLRRGQARRELAMAIHAAAAAEQALQRVVLALREAGRQIDRERVAGVTGCELAVLAGLHERTRAQVPPQRERRDAAAEQEDAARGSLAAATREAQVLERLREESRARFLAEEGRREQAEGDDLVLVRRTRGVVVERARRARS